MLALTLCNSVHLAISIMTLSCILLYLPSPSELGNPVKMWLRVQTAAPQCLQDGSSSLPRTFRLLGVGKRSATAHRRKDNFPWLLPQSSFEDSDRSSASSYCIHCPWQASPAAFTRRSSSAASRTFWTTRSLLSFASALPHVVVL